MCTPTPRRWLDSHQLLCCNVTNLLRSMPRFLWLQRHYRLLRNTRTAKKLLSSLHTLNGHGRNWFWTDEKAKTPTGFLFWIPVGVFFRTRLESRLFYSVQLFPISKPRIFVSTNLIENEKSVTGTYQSPLGPCRAGRFVAKCHRCGWNWVQITDVRAIHKRYPKCLELWVKFLVKLPIWELGIKCAGILTEFPLRSMKMLCK